VRPVANVTRSADAGAAVASIQPKADAAATAARRIVEDKSGRTGMFYRGSMNAWKTRTPSSRGSLLVPLVTTLGTNVLSTAI